jgi:hypothetical protein
MAQTGTEKKKIRPVKADFSFKRIHHVCGMEAVAKELLCYNTHSPVNQEILIEGRPMLWKKCIVHVR